jgi:uncharacterized DUF497 family protein
MPLEFEWDDAKSAANLRKHVVSFEAALQLFLDPTSIDVPTYSGNDPMRRMRIGCIDDRAFICV